LKERSGDCKLCFSGDQKYYKNLSLCFMRLKLFPYFSED
jgi:hypothetical protein